MEIYASQRYVRQAPRKVRLVANAVKDLPLESAFHQLSVMQRRASLPVVKTLRQAVANASHNFNLTPAELKIKSIVVEGGPIYKRFRAVSRGRAHSIQKKTCHIVVRLEQITDLPKIDSKMTKPAQMAKPDKTAAISSSKSAGSTIKSAKSAKATRTQSTKKTTSVKKQEKTAKK